MDKEMEKIYSEALEDRPMETEAVRESYKKISKEEYRKYIIDAVNRINNKEYLNRILNYVMKYRVKE